MRQNATRSPCLFGVGGEFDAVELGDVEAYELLGGISLACAQLLFGCHARDELRLVFVASSRVRGLHAHGVFLESGADHGELACGLGGAVVVGGAGGLLLCGRCEVVAGEDDAGDGEHHGSREDAPADPMRLREYQLVLLHGDNAVVVEVAFERRAEQEQDDLGGKADKDHVDAELIERGEEEPGVGRGDAVARGAQGRHEGRCNCDSRDDGGWLLVTRVAQRAGKTSHQREEQVPHSGVRVVGKGGRHAGGGGEYEVYGGRYQAKCHLQREPGQGVARKRPVERGRAVGDGEHRSHDGTDEHGAHDGDVGVRVQADAGDDHGDDEDAQVRAGESGSVDKALANGVVGGSPLADVEASAEESLRLAQGAVGRGSLAVAPAMAIDVLLPHVVVSGQSLFTCRSDSRPTLLARAAILALLGRRDISACRPSILAGAFTRGLRAFSRLNAIYIGLFAGNQAIVQRVFGEPE